MKLSIRDRRVAAPAILGSLLLAAILSAGMQRMALGTAQLERDAKQELLARLRDANPARAGARQEPDENPFVVSETATLAAAEIDRLLRAVVARVNGAVLSTQAAVEHDDDAAMRRIEMQAVIEGPIEAIQRTLFSLETGVPVIFISDLDLQPVERSAGKREAVQAPRLQTTLTLSAFWRNAP